MFPMMSFKPLSKHILFPHFLAEKIQDEICLKSINEMGKNKFPSPYI